MIPSMIRIKIISVSLGSDVDVLEKRLEESLKGIDPAQVIEITQNNVVGYTIFYDDEEEDKEEDDE